MTEFKYDPAADEKAQQAAQNAADKEAAAKQEAEYRRLARIHAEEAERLRHEQEIKNIPNMSDEEFRRLKARWGC